MELPTGTVLEGSEFAVSVSLRKKLAIDDSALITCISNEEGGGMGKGKLVEEKEANI